MLYMMQTFGKRETWDADMASWPRDRFRQLIAFMTEVNDELQESGELVEARGLGGPGDATTVRATGNGGPAVEEGPHEATRDVLAGYWVLDVPSHERAVEIAARVSACPGPDGRPENTPIELHRIPSGPPEV